MRLLGWHQPDGGSLCPQSPLVTDFSSSTLKTLPSPYCSWTRLREASHG